MIYSSIEGREKEKYKELITSIHCFVTHLLKIWKHPDLQVNWTNIISSVEYSFYLFRHRLNAGIKNYIWTLYLSLRNCALRAFAFFCLFVCKLRIFLYDFKLLIAICMYAVCPTLCEQLKAILVHSMNQHLEFYSKQQNK